MSGYAAKESVLCCLLHTSANVETRDGGWGSLELIVWSSVVRFVFAGGGRWLGGSFQLLLFWHEGHVEETWTPQYVMR